MRILLFRAFRRHCLSSSLIDYCLMGVIGVFSFFSLCIHLSGFFFFQAEDGIRDWSVTGVQTCALPISRTYPGGPAGALAAAAADTWATEIGAFSPFAPRLITSGRQVPRGTSGGITVLGSLEIGRASCRERVQIPDGRVSIRNRRRSTYA